MDKSKYQERSRKLRLPQRCPLVGYCQRWAWTIYFYNYMDLPNPTNDIGDVLSKAGDLPPDYDEKKVQLAVEAPTIAKGEDYYWVENLCPEVPLFNSGYVPGIVPSEAVASFSWVKGHGMEYIDHKHFSECLEFIQSNVKKPKRTGLPPKIRFQVLSRDKFTCVYCGKSREQGAVLHVDHKTSVRDGGSDDPDNLVTSCEDCNFGKGARSMSPDRTNANEAG